MNPAPTRLQQIETELAEIRKNIAKLENVKPVKAKPAEPNIVKPKKGTPRTNLKLKNAIKKYREDHTLRLASHWIEGDGSIEGFQSYFRDWSIPDKLAILESAFPDNFVKIDKYLYYDPECESE
jgi:hypothetical protein